MTIKTKKKDGSRIFYNWVVCQSKGKTSGTIFLMSTQEKRFQKKCNLYFSKEHKMRDSLGTLSVH